MSDITKKIFSIEQSDDETIRSDRPKSDIIRPLVDETAAGAKAQPHKTVSEEKVPEFVTRDTIRPLSSPPAAYADDTKPLKSTGWIVFGLGLLYFIGAGLYFGLPLFKTPLGLLPVAGLALLLILPLILLFLLWRTLRHLSNMSAQNARLSKAAEILVSPDQEALARTENLAGGIRAEITRVNSSLSDTVEVLKKIQIGVTQESQALDAAGLALSRRSDEVGQNLTLQRQVLESLTGSIDARMSSLSTQIADKGQILDEMCSAAETKILGAGEALVKASADVDEATIVSADRIGEKITALEDTRSKMEQTAEAFTSDIGNSTEKLLETDRYFAEYSEKFQSLNSETQSQITDLQAIIGHGYEMLENLKATSETRASDVASYYDTLSKQLKQSEDDTLAAQGQTARMVESNLAQMRRDFSKMETDIQSLQVKLNRLRESSDEIDYPDPASPRLNLKPLDTDFPPVEPAQHRVRPDPVEVSDRPLNLGVDMEIESPDEPLIKFEPEVIRRPGDVSKKPKSRGFGRRTDKEEKSGWRWKDMLGTLDRPDAPDVQRQVVEPRDSGSMPSQNIDGVSLLKGLKSSPAAIVDEGTVVDATQARINSGEPGLSSVVKDKLPEAVALLKDNLAADPILKANLYAFTVEFSKTIGNTPPTAPALRAAFGSPEGRAYLLCAAAFKPELR